MSQRSMPLVAILSLLFGATASAGERQPAKQVVVTPEDGHADIDHVDLGSIGWWGEWHLSGSKYKLPTLEHRRQVVDAYLAAFKKTPLVLLIGGGDCLKYVCDHGAGWRADCLGDMGGFSKNWCHMRKGYRLSNENGYSKILVSK